MILPCLGLPQGHDPLAIGLHGVMLQVRPRPRQPRTVDKLEKHHLFVTVLTHDSH